MLLLDLDGLIRMALFLEAALVLGVVATLVTNRKAEKPVRRARWLKLGVYGLLVHVMLVVLLTAAAPFLILVLAVASFIEFVTLTLRQKKGETTLRIVFIFLYIGILSGVMFFVFSVHPLTLAYTYVLVAVLDAYSQLSGQLLGKHLLAPALSPRKTWEGILGGGLFTLVAAVFLMPLVKADIAATLLGGVAIVVFGVSGDLLGSGYKRWLGVKDFSSILPGQGGFNDRFNSLFLVCFFLGISQLLFHSS